MSVPIPLKAYRVATQALAVAAPVWLSWRARNGKEPPGRIGERYGIPSLPRPPGHLTWCHAASVGETMSVLPLVEVLHQRQMAVLLTTGTITAAQLVHNRAARTALHQFAPLDHGPWIEAFLDHWRPDVALRVDSEIWPNTLLALYRHHIPIIQINARMSEKAHRGWAQFPNTARAIFGRFNLVAAQSEEDRQRFERLGVRAAITSGNLKLAQAPLPFDADALESLKTAIGARPTWIAASIHPGEDAIVGRAQTIVQAEHPRALAIAVPRHPQRGPDMARMFRSFGLHVAVRSQGDAISPETSIYIADTMGELGLFYRLSPLAFIGKTFAVGGGQNPAEAAQLGCALVWGPDMSNFAVLAHDLEARAAALKLDSPAKLGETIASLINDTARISRMGTAGRSYIADNADALDRTLQLLAPYLERLPIS